MKTKKNILALALLLGLSGSFISMMEWDLSQIIPLFTYDFSLSGLGDGFLLLFNRLFAISQQHQLFIYTMFPISLPQNYWDGNTALALAAFTLFFALLSFALVYIRNKMPIMLIMLAVVFVQVYFGVFPSALWNIILFTTFALILVDKQNTGLQGNIALVVLIGLVSATIFIANPHPNPQLSHISEALRDRFDTPINPLDIPYLGMHQAYFRPLPEDHHLNPAYVDDPHHNSPTEEYFVELDEVAYGAEIGLLPEAPSLLPALLFVAALIIIAMLFRFAPPLIKASKRRKTFNIEDTSIAINNMFIYLLEWLEIIGLERKNIPFSAYTPQISTLVHQQYSEEYKNATTLWQKAIYSNQIPNENERQHIKEFLDKTIDIVWTKASFATKLKVKFQHFL